MPLARVRPYASYAPLPDCSPHWRNPLILAALLMATLPQVTAPGPAGRQAQQTPPGRAASASTTLPYRAPLEDPLTPRTVISVPSGPRVARLPSPGSPVVAIRLSIAFEEAPSEAGMGNLLQEAQMERVRAQAAPRGIQVEGARTPWGIAYTVVGARADFDQLASLLQEAASEPNTTEAALSRMKLSLRSRLLREQETPGARAFAELRARAIPGSPAPLGTPSSVEAITLVMLKDFWRRSHRDTAMTVVLAGDVEDRLLYTAFDELGSPRGTTARAPTAAAQTPAAPTQTFRQWYGEAFTITGEIEPHAPVVALLAAERLASASDSLEGSVQLWESNAGSVIAVVAAAYPANAARLRPRVSALFTGIRQDATAPEVLQAAARARQDLLDRARTPAGLVTMVGRMMDATGEPAAARRLLDALGRVTHESTRTFLTQLTARPPLRVELRP
jgi:hypothetical protein